MPVLQPNTTQVDAWLCDTCCEDYNGKMDQPWETIEGGDLVCTKCIRQQFERALELDYDWPARWGGEELLISDFESIFSPELVSQVKDKAAEMAAIDRDALLEAVKDLNRGKDYQTCPTCSQIIMLKDGCNHMECIFCPTGFCFLCGEEVRDPDRSGHWTASAGCPRYGPAGSGRFDPDRFSDYGDVQPDDGLYEAWYYRNDHIAPLSPGWYYEDDESMFENMPEWRSGHQARWRRFGALNIGTWTFNLAMQSLRGNITRQQQLRLVLEDAETDARPLFENFEALVRQYRPEHFVQEQDWVALFESARPDIRAFFDNGPTNEIVRQPVPAVLIPDPLEQETNLLQRGLLKQPVGAVFNMMSRDQRIAAIRWMCHTTRDWETLSIPQRSAVFDMGPGEDDQMRLRVSDMMYGLHREGYFEHFTFFPMQRAGLLITAGPIEPVEAQDSSVFVPGEAYWRRVILREFWGELVHLESIHRTQRVARDPGNIVWRDLMQEASDAWLEQRPDGALGEEVDF